MSGPRLPPFFLRDSKIKDEWESRDKTDLEPKCPIFALKGRYRFVQDYPLPPNKKAGGVYLNYKLLISSLSSDSVLIHISPVCNAMLVRPPSRLL